MLPLKIIKPLLTTIPQKHARKIWKINYSSIARRIFHNVLKHLSATTCPSATTLNPCFTNP